MKYKDTFVFSKIPYSTNIDLNEYDKNELIEYKDYESQLDDEFYLRVFIYKLLFEIDIIDLEDFLLYQNNYSMNSIKFLNILDLKVVPNIEKILENAIVNFSNGGTPNGENLGNGFYRSGNRIYNHRYDFFSMYQRVGGQSFVAEYKKSLEIVKNFLNELNFKENINKINWTGGPAALGFIFNQLYQNGYIDSEKINGELNATNLARKIYSLFSFQEKCSVDSLRKYLSSGDQKFEATSAKFDRAGFKLPQKDFL